MEVLRRRNQKNLYEESAGELVGVGVGMEEPQQPDLVVINDGRESPEKIAEEILRKAAQL